MPTIVLVAAAIGFQIGTPVYRRYAAVREIERVGGWVQTSQDFGPRWLRDLVGEEIMVRTFDDIESVLLADTEATNATLRALHGLPRIRDLWLRNTTVSDAGMAHLKALSELESLLLSDTQVTDDGLVHLKSLKKLRDLNLCDTRVTDAGLEHLKGLSNLERLWLYNTAVTDKGADELETALPKLGIGRNSSAFNDFPE